MAEYTVLDIKGKGFKYEQYAQEQDSSLAPPTGTFGCFIGTSNWGPINTPYIITGGLSEFRNVFGFAGTRIDHGWTAADLHFRANSALGIYTRLADESLASRSYTFLKDKKDRPAVVIGKKDIRNGVLMSGNEDSLDIYVQYQEDGDVIKEMDTLNINFSDILSSPANINVYFRSVSVTYGVRDKIEIQVIDNNDSSLSKRINIVFSENTTFSNLVDFRNYILNANNQKFYNLNDTTNTEIVDPKPLLSTLLSVDEIVDGTFNISATDLKYSIKIIDNINKSNYSKTSKVDALKTPYVSILEKINAAFNDYVDENNNTEGVASYSFASINEDGYLVLTGINTGENSEIYINGGTSLDILGLQDYAESEIGFSGVIGTSLGIFRAKYKGVEGNTVKVRFYKNQGIPSINIIFRENLISTISDYNFDPASENFIENLINNDPVANQVIKYNHGETFINFNDSDTLQDDGLQLYQNDNATLITNRIDWEIEDNIYTLAEGDSGENSQELNYNILSIIEQLKNIDLYDIDYIVAPGYEEENVQNALLDLCAYRQDCFAFLDMPFIPGTNRDKAQAIEKAKRYIDGLYLRSDRIDSIYGVLAFPYLVLRKRYYNSQTLLVSETLLMSPTVILPYLYTLKDTNTNTTFDIAAGETYGGRILLSPNDFQGAQFILNQEERTAIYADSLDACINPIAFNTLAGFFLDGQKTTLRKNLNGKLTSLSRISVMRTGLFIKKNGHRISRQYFFAPIDPTTWIDFSKKLTREIMQPLVNNRMIEPNFIVKCDSTTNTDQVRNNNGMVAYIEFTPYKKVERIKIVANITETSTTVSLA